MLFKHVFANVGIVVTVAGVVNIVAVFCNSCCCINFVDVVDIVVSTVVFTVAVVVDIVAVFLFIVVDTVVVIVAIVADIVVVDFLVANVPVVVSCIRKLFFTVSICVISAVMKNCDVKFLTSYQLH